MMGAWITDIDGEPLEPSKLESATEAMLHEGWDTDEQGIELFTAYAAVVRADWTARIRLAVESAWNEQCSGNKNTDVCESCRAYNDVLETLGRLDD